MKIQICSDLHIDYNRKSDFEFKEHLNDVDLTIIAGDIAGDYQYESAFLNSLQATKPVVCVGGNHLGYNYLYRKNKDINPYDGTKEWSLNYLQEKFNGPIYYLENRDILVNNHIVFAGTMYSDFNLYNNIPLCGLNAEQSMNDFRLVYTNGDEGIRKVKYTDYIIWFNQFIKHLKTRIAETAEDGLDIIVVTHFAPSIKSIGNQYGNDYTNAAYASNLEEFILDNPRIKLWVHGHMHENFDYMIGNCRIICNPCGYISDDLTDIEYKSKIITL